MSVRTVAVATTIVALVAIGCGGATFSTNESGSNGGNHDPTCGDLSKPSLACGSGPTNYTCASLGDGTYKWELACSDAGTDGGTDSGTDGGGDSGGDGGPDGGDAGHDGGDGGDGGNVGPCAGMPKPSINIDCQPGYNGELRCEKNPMTGVYSWQAECVLSDPCRAQCGTQPPVHPVCQGGGGAVECRPSTASQCSWQPVCPDFPLLWGGDGGQLTLSQSNGSLDLDCASGELDGPILPDASGAFSVGGTYTQGSGVPLPQPPPPVPVTYTGVIQGSTMILKFVVNGTPYELTLTANMMGTILRCG
jgi:hypothetical protein